MTVSHGKPYAGKPHVRFDEGAGVPDKGRSALLHGYGVVEFSHASALLGLGVILYAECGSSESPTPVAPVIRRSRREARPLCLWVFVLLR